jgi:DNA-3-methyladenine glycosylase II
MPEPLNNSKAAVAHLMQSDPILAEVISQYGEQYTITAHKNYYQELVDSIISQQLSVKAAATIQKRFCQLFGSEDLPSPEQILEKDVEELRSAGLSRPKASYIQDLAAKVLDGSVQFDHLEELSNQEIIAELTTVKGIGVWTVHMFLIFCMGRLDVLAFGDLGVRNGIQKLYGLDKVPDQATVEGIATKNHWHPYESVACWYIWKSLDNVPSV